MVTFSVVTWQRKHHKNAVTVTDMMYRKWKIKQKTIAVLFLRFRNAQYKTPKVNTFDLAQGTCGSQAVQAVVLICGF